MNGDLESNILMLFYHIRHELDKAFRYIRNSIKNLIMKRPLLLILAVSLISTAFSQVYSDDFESYTVGDLIAATNSSWTTWSNSPGSAEDAPISDAQAFSGSNSLYLSSVAAGGGPQDLVLPLGGHYTDGHMAIEMELFVEVGKGGYFNFQGLPTIGQDWSLNLFFLQTGELYATDNSGTVAVGNFGNGNWFNLTFDIDLTSNTWEILVNGNSLGNFSAASNQLASIDFFPYNAAGNGGNDISGYYVDDISYEFTPYVPLPLDAALYTVDVPTLGLTGQQKNVNGSVINLGTTTIDSFDLEWTYGTSSGSENITGVSIPNLGTYDFSFTAPITLEAGTNGLNISISNVNASVDDDISNNDGTTNIDAVTPAPNKVVVGEEATGTWCGWCPRGTVFLEYMHENYDGYFQGIAVHDSDPMVVPAYDDGLGATGFPNMQVDRNGWIDPSQVELGFINRIVEPAYATLINGAEFDAGTSNLFISSTANATDDLIGDYRMAVAIVENEVTGTGAQWAQANYYSGGGSGVMGGFELLADPVPAAEMIYQDVARAILGGFNGIIIPDLLAGESANHIFNYTIPADQDMDEMKIVSMIIAPNGRVHNAGISTVAEAIANGVTGLEDPSTEIFDLNVFPNPAVEQTTITLDLANDSKVSIEIFDAIGKLVMSKDYGTLSGEMIFPIRTQNLKQGSYVIMTNIDGTILSKKLVVTK